MLMLVSFIPSSVGATSYATVFHPTTGDRKVVIVGDPTAFNGGFLLETPTNSIKYWVDRLININTKPISDEEFDLIPERAWYEITPQIMNQVPKQEVLGGDGSLNIVNISVCRGDDCLQYQKDPLLGFSVVTRYRTRLSSSMTSSQTTVPVSSVTTFDDTVLTIASLGGKVFLSLEPGTSREEIVKCTGLSSTTWSSCTRGLAFSGTSEAAVSANQKAHNAGSIVVMSNVHYVYEQLIDKDTSEQTVSGDLQAGWITVASSTQTLQRNILGTTTPAYFENNAGVLYYCNNGASCTAIGAGASTYNFLPSLRVDGTEVGVATSSNQYWFELDNNSNFVVATGTGTGFFHEFNRLFNATSTADGFNLASTTFSGNNLQTGNNTTTGSFNVDGRFLVKGNDVAVGGAATTTVATTTHSGSGSTTLFTYAVPANAIGTDGYIKVIITASSTDSGSGTADNKLSVQYGGQEACAFNNSNNSNYYLIGLVYGECTIFADNATNKQGSMGWWISHGQSTSLSVANGTAGVATTTGQTVDSTSAQNITIVASASDSGDSLGLYRALVQIFKF